ncbi:MAG: radical SAM family heme chaperone HemW [Bacteroidota bacterium]
MAGVYVHIPFCKQACNYCDFHFSTNLKNTKAVVDAICLEIVQRGEVSEEVVETIYFGGGTPTILEAASLSKILDQVFQSYTVSTSPEITIEGNPEDLAIQGKGMALREAGFNRLSLGFQTFADEKLKWMNRSHDMHEAVKAFDLARLEGFDNISLDLIYALPDEEQKAIDQWNSDLEKAIELSPEHLSLYGLTIENSTPFGRRKRAGKFEEVPESIAAGQYIAAVNILRSNGYKQYEVSNFGKPGKQSRHNLAYWDGIPYDGIGPGAHSFDGKTRRVNVANNQKYVTAASTQTDFWNAERLNNTELLNERILTALRKAEGISFSKIFQDFSRDLAKERKSLFEQFAQQDLLILDENSARLTTQGFLVADEIALHLFFDE